MQQPFYLLENTFKQKLAFVKVGRISKNELVLGYLKKILEQQDYYLKIFSWILEAALQQTQKGISEISLLDFGCGNGLFAIYAKHCGFKKVYACDFNIDFVNATKILANEVGIYLDDVFASNEDELFNQCININLDIIVGTDVIEHIYNLDTFFANIHRINTNMITAFTTASVYENYFKRMALYRLMYQDEYISSNILEATAKDEYAGLAYLNIRQMIISKAFPTLQNEEIIQLAKVTRGFRKDDIIKHVNYYIENKTIPKQLKNKHNTCDPITGNYTERIMQMNEYKNIYTSNGFNLIIKTGFYAASKNVFKGFIQKCLNIFISTLHNTSLSRIVAPLILLVGVSQKNKK